MFAVIWFILAIAVGIFGSNRGRSGFGWFLISALLSPLIGLILLLATKDLSKPQATSQSPSDNTHRKCPACAEWVLPEASVCKHCGATLQPDIGFHNRKAIQAASTKKQENTDLFIGICSIAAIFFIVYVISQFTR